MADTTNVPDKSGTFVVRITKSSASGASGASGAGGAARASTCAGPRLAVTAGAGNDERRCANHNDTANDRSGRHATG